MRRARRDRFPPLRMCSDRGKLCTDVGIIGRGELVHQGTMEEFATRRIAGR